MKEAVEMCTDVVSTHHVSSLDVPVSKKNGHFLRGAPVRGQSRAIHSGVRTNMHSPATPRLLCSPTLQWYSKPGVNEGFRVRRVFKIKPKTLWFKFS